MLRLLQIEREQDRCTAEDLLEACKQYFSMRHEQLSCFDELRTPLEVLETNLQQDFVDFALETAKTKSESGNSSVIPYLNTLKFEYCFLISPKTAIQPAQDFSCKAIDIYQQFCTTKKDSGEPGTQLAMLACTALLQPVQAVREGMMDRNLHIISYLQAAFLLRYCLTRSKDNYPTLVVLTRILTLLGSVSLSATFFKRLSIKNLQWENAGHLLLTRLSTLHPQRSNSESTFDPLQMLDLAIAANNTSVKSARRLIMVGLNHKSYINVMETISLREDLKKSFSKQMYCIENARAQRLRDIPSSARDDLSSGGAEFIRSEGSRILCMLTQ
jgi:N-terminal acetyltransferase B complex non-catalytic subunit